MRLIATAVALAVFCFGVVNAEEFMCKITKVDGSKVTLNKGTKDEPKVDDVTLTATDAVKVFKGKWNNEAKKLDAGDAIADGLKADIFTKISEKGVRALVITDNDKKITEIRVSGDKKPEDKKQPDAKKQPEKKKGLDLGVVSLEKLNKADLAVPAADAKVPQVGLKSAVMGQTAKDEKLSVFVAVNAIGSADAKDTFWVQKLPKMDGGKFKAECQFGEGATGKGEYFAVIAFTSKSEIAAGDQLDLAALQKAAASYSAVLIVQRKK